MKEIEPDSKWDDNTLNVGYGELDAVVVSGPTEDGQLATLTVLMRIYDVQMALLNHFDSSLADEIYEVHHQGETYNPPLFIPQFGVKTDAEDSD